MWPDSFIAYSKLASVFMANCDDIHVHYFELAAKKSLKATCRPGRCSNCTYPRAMQPNCCITVVYIRRGYCC